MAIEYDVIQAGTRIMTYPKGALNTHDTIEYFNQLKNDKRIKQGAVEIVNFKDVTDFQITYLDSQEITKNYQDPKAIQMIESTVFVCETKLAYGIGRMLQTFHEITNPDHKVLVVDSESKVEGAIKQPE